MVARNDKASIRYRQFEGGYAQVLDSQLRLASNKPVARRVLRHIARGSATTVEALFCFAYFLRRIPQRKPMQRLQSNEYYARLRYAEFEAWTGVHRATQSRILHRLVSRGYLNTAPDQKQNENAYGQLFIDGPLLSLVRPRQASRSLPPTAKKTSTPPRDMVNASYEKKSTLRNLNPKTEILEREKLIHGLKNGFLARHCDPELQRMATRAVQMVENLVPQAA